MKTVLCFFKRTVLAGLCLTLLIVVSGCQTRSISNADYPGPYAGNTLYRGELSDFDVLDGEDQPITEADIGKAMDTRSRVKLRKGSSVLLIQSGAMFPDEAMVTELSSYVNPVAFSGVPAGGRDRGPAANDSRPSYAKALRLAAARGGCETIICYWGVLESAQKELVSKSVSWVPVVGWTLPDESQRMRIRLKIALIDVRSGSWSIFIPRPIETKALSGMINREGADERQVETLKQKAYETAAKDLLQTYGN